MRISTNGRSTSDGRREFELLLACARVSADPITAGRITELIACGIDWDYLFAAAQRHLVLPLLHHQLSLSAVGYVPAEQFEKLKSQFRDNAARNIFHEGELWEILRDFRESGIEAVPFKGPTLARLAYGNIALRRFIDLDILVRRQDLQKAKAALLNRGYELRPQLTRAQESVLLRSQHNLQFVRDGGRLIVELHWEVVKRSYARSLRAEDFWGRLIQKRFDGKDVLSLSTEDLLIALCAHGTKHLWERLVWICDVAELLNSCEDLDWKAVVNRASAAGHDRMLLLGVRLAYALLNAKVPAEIRKIAYSDVEVSKLESLVNKRLFDSVEFEPAGTVQNIRFNMHARKSWWDRLRYYGFILSPTDADIASVKLPAGMTPLYFLLRPIRLLTRGRQSQ